MRRCVVLAVLTACALVVATAAFGGEPFVGENLVYEFGWQGFTAARAEIKIGSIDYNGEDCYKIKVNIRSLARLEWVWKVRDKFTSYTRKRDLVPEYFFYEQREGKFSLDTEIKLDREDNILRSTRTRYKDGKTKSYKPKWSKATGMNDPLGALVSLRKQDLKVGDVYEVNVFDGKRKHQISYAVSGKETIKTPFGDREAFVVHPKVQKSTGDKKNSKVEKVQKVTMWLATTPEHNVLRVESKAWIGSVFAELVKK